MKQMTREFYLSYLVENLKARNIFDVCKNCYKDKTTHTCCIDCKFLINNTCSSRNLNCTLWFCDRIINRMTFFDIMNFSLVALEVIDEKKNTYRARIDKATKEKKRTYYGALSRYITYFNDDPVLKVLIKFHYLKERVRGLINNKVYIYR